MTITKTDTLVVGAGQAGIAMSEHLERAGIPHLVLEKARVAESWRTARWDSLVANGPAWHDRFPGMEFAGDPDAFVPKDDVAAYFAAYAERIAAPIRTGVEVTRMVRNGGGFRVETSDGIFEATRVVAATGPFQRPVMPALVPETADVLQIHSNAYRNPDALPAGGVLVVGAGSSGVQIADELNRAGRRVWLSVGAHDRPPRAYRGRDFCWWLGVLGKWDASVREAGREHVTIAVSGARGGETIDFRRLAHEGITLVGMTRAHDNGCLSFAPDLAANIAAGDSNLMQLLDEADAYAAKMGLDLPDDAQARRILPDPACLTDPVASLDLKAEGIATILWATGYSADYGWMQIDAFDAQGKPIHQRGVSAEPGVYFLGLPWQSRRGSSFIWGVWHDAKYIADQIAIQRSYSDYHAAAQSRARSDA